jgi:hypothetical protein
MPYRCRKLLFIHGVRQYITGIVISNRWFLYYIVCSMNEPEVIFQIGSAFENKFWILKEIHLLVLECMWGCLIPQLSLCLWAFVLRICEPPGGLQPWTGSIDSVQVTRGQCHFCLPAPGRHLAGCLHSSTSHHQRCQPSSMARQFGATRKWSWHIMQTFNTWLSLEFGTVLSGATKWNCTSAGTQGNDHLSSS